MTLSKAETSTQEERWQQWRLKGARDEARFWRKARRAAFVAISVVCVGGALALSLL